MPKDDYFYIRYKILLYLYECAKRGETPDKYHILTAESYGINQSYFDFIMKNLYKDGFIDDACSLKFPHRATAHTLYPKNVEITTKGIEYLTENSMMEKAKNFLKEIKDIIPGL